VFGKPFDPLDRPHQLRNLSKARQNAKDEHKQNRPVQIGVRPKDRRYLRTSKIQPCAHKPQDDQHRNDLSHGLRELRLYLGFPYLCGHTGALILIVKGILMKTSANPK
jgi:hypothetical protein